MTRTISSSYQSSLGWPPEGDPFDDDIDENGDWIAVPEVEVSLAAKDQDSDDQEWVRPRLYRLGPTPKHGITAAGSAPVATYVPSPNDDQVLVMEGDELTKIPAAGEPVSLPGARETVFAELTGTAIESHQLADPTPQCDALSTADRNRRDLQTVRTLSIRAAAGDEPALNEIRTILDSNEDLWRYLGNVEQTTLDYLIHVLLEAPHIKESTRRTVAELKVSLLSPDPTPLEKLATGRVMACWLFAHIVDRRVAHAINDGRQLTGLPKLLEAGEKRLQTAIKSLMLVQSIVPR